MIRIVAISFFLLAVQAQQAGTIESENHPSLTWETCTSTTSCSTITGKLTLDANYRWLHHVNFTSNCFTGGWNASTCPDNVSCAKNCALDGTDYAQSAAVRVLKNELRLTYSSTIDDPYHFTSRLFLLSDDTHCQLFNLLNKEISFTVDTSRLPCGLSASVKLLSIDEDGGVARFPGNKAGAKYGTGYCDATCSRDVRFVDGKANVESWTPSPNIVGLGAGGHGSCCMEVNVFEGNSVSNTLAAHSCDSSTSAICSGDGCLSKSPCDAVGCDLNPYRMGNTSFFGPGKVVDTNKLFTVVTQFLTTDRTNSGTLKQVKRFYIQNGVKISTPDSSITGTTGNSLTSSFCAAQKSSFSEADSFSKHGGLEAIGKALAKGMVLAMSLNDGGDDGLEWLDGTFPATATPTADGVKRGPCEKQGSPASLQTVSPRPVVSFGKIRVGDLGSTG